MALIPKKVKAAVAGGLIAMLCVGETLSEREAGETLKVVSRQLREGLSLIAENVKDLTDDKVVPVVIAYEPVWAIGTGKVATVKEVEEAHKAVRENLTKILGDTISAQTPILYGGSVKPENAVELAATPNVDGFLVGGASLKPKDFFQIYCTILTHKER